MSDRLEKESIPEPNSGCLLWLGAVNKKGYGCLWFGEEMWRVHRLAWTKGKGPIPKGLHVLHRCDTRSCIELTHLFLGTDKDNKADCVAKGRHRKSKKLVR